MRNIKMFVFVFFIQCNDNKNEKIYTLFDNIEKKYNQSFIKEFKETPEDIVLDIYFSYFLYLYGELAKDGDDIKTFLRSLGLNEEPSQAYVFILIWHRKLNSKKLNLKELLYLVGDETKGVRSCINKKKINSVFNFKKLHINENVQLVFPVRIESNIKSTVFYDCPVLNWEFNRSKDLIINGEIINKYFKGNPKEPYIQLKIKDMNREDVLYFFEQVQKKDTIEVNLNSYGINI